MKKTIMRKLRSLRNLTFWSIYDRIRIRVNVSTDIVVIKHKGQMLPKQVVYVIQSGTKNQSYSGFFASMRGVLKNLAFADVFNMKPVVEWGKGNLYYDKDMAALTDNVFEYYFEPVADISSSDVDKCRNVVYSMMSYEKMCVNYSGKTSYAIDEEELEYLAYLYKKYIRLNEATKNNLKKMIEPILNGKKTLGIHVRGSDYQQVTVNHPTFITPTEYIEKAFELCAEGNYDQIFLATDDKHVLKLFQEAFGDLLIYYDDTVRSDNDLSVVMQEEDRPYHHYKLGLEVLRDVYTLAYCDSLIAGLSQVSFAVRYINISLGRSFEKKVIMNKGINKTGRKIVKQLS